MSKDRPILFSAPMVRALLAGSKTQTRRALKTLGADGADWVHNANMGGPGGGIWWDLGWYGTQKINRFRCPYGVPGDRLWVREAWAADHPDLDTVRRGVESDGDFYGPFFRATDSEPCSGYRWRSSIHMPRWASRLTLTITNVRVQRLREISEEDAIAEGLKWVVPGMWSVDSVSVSVISRDPREAYFQLWDHINGEGTAEANPWVWAVSFTVEQANVGQAKAA